MKKLLATLYRTNTGYWCWDPRSGIPGAILFYCLLIQVGMCVIIGSIFYKALFR